MIKYCTINEYNHEAAMVIEFSSCYSTSVDGNSATVLYTLRRPEGVEFSGGVTGALMNTIMSASPDVVVSSITRYGK